VGDSSTYNYISFSLTRYIIYIAYARKNQYEHGYAFVHAYYLFQ